MHTFGETLLLGCVLGLAGASFAVALPLASSWYPPEHQGTALGLAGAGNSGTVLAALFAPGLAMAFGWQNVVGLAAVPLTVTLCVFIAIAKDSPKTPARKTFADYAAILRVPDAWWFMFFYSVTFGGFVGLASSLTIYFNDQYGVSPVIAGYCTAAVVFVGSLVRPLGGAVADRIGGVRRADRALRRRLDGVRHHRHRHLLDRPGVAGVHPWHAVPRHGQRRGVPTGAATLRQGNRRDDRPCRHDRRRRRLLPRLQPRLLEAIHRRLRAGLSDLRAARRRRAGLPDQSARPLALHMGGAVRRGEGLTMNMIAASRRRLVLVGNGMAGVRALEEILGRAPHMFAITVFGAEPHGNYNRIMLSPVLAGEKTVRRHRHP